MESVPTSQSILARYNDGNEHFQTYHRQTPRESRSRQKGLKILGIRESQGKTTCESMVGRQARKAPALALSVSRRACVRSAGVSQCDRSRVTHQLWSNTNSIRSMDDWATSTQAVYRRAMGSAMSQSAEDAVAVVEQRRIDALLTADINVLDEMIDAQCTHIESNGTSRTKAAFLEDVAKRAFSFDLFEIEENHIRIFGDTAVVAGTYRNIVRVRGTPNPVKHARHLRVYVHRSGSWKLIAHQATEIAPRSH